VTKNLNLPFLSYLNKILRFAQNDTLGFLDRFLKHMEEAVRAEKLERPKWKQKRPPVNSRLKSSPLIATGLFLMLGFGIWLLSDAEPVYAGLQETLPTHHWAYSYIDELRLRGHFGDLFASNRPFTRGEVAEQLHRLKEQGEETPGCAVFLDRLNAEFEDEIRQLSENEEGASQIQMGATLAQDGVARRDEDLKAYGIYRLEGGYFTDHVAAVDVAKLDRYLKEDPTYQGENWRGLTAYMEQAYLRVRFENFQATFGRDFLRWGPGRTGALLLSDDHKPLDFFSFSYRLRWAKFTYFFSILDDYKLNAQEHFETPWTRLVNRFLTAQRLDFNLWGGKLHIGLSEAILFADSERTFGLSYFNPLTNYFELVENEGDGNIFANVDVRVLPFPNSELYGELLIDDYQVDREAPGDLEPNEIGLILGAELADILGWAPTTLGIEYVRITNRTYNTLAPWEKFLYRGKCIGYPLGNDFDRWEGTIRHTFPSGFGAALKVGYLRKGEGAVEKAFDTPWMLVSSVEEGYSEPFPTGMVAKTWTTGGNLSFQPTRAFRGMFDAEWGWTQNADHVRGKRAYSWSCTLGVWWNLRKIWGVGGER